MLAFKLSTAFPGMGFIPYGYSAYDEFYEYLDSIKTADGKLANLLQLYKNDIKCRNIKENWSIAKYVGHDIVDNITYGRYYYFPCNDKFVEYEGIIDNEEFTSYASYSLERKDWIVAEDPLGMLAQTLHC